MAAEFLARAGYKLHYIQLGKVGEYSAPLPLALRLFLRTSLAAVNVTLDFSGFSGK
jgi:hypothetical protein